MKTEQELIPITWESLASDDFVFRYERYCLRVEQMNKKYWWWAVYFGDLHIAFDDPRAKTENEAKYLAEIYFLRHKFSGLLEQEQIRKFGYIKIKHTPNHKT